MLGKLLLVGALAFVADGYNVGTKCGWYKYPSGDANGNCGRWNQLSGCGTYCRCAEDAHNIHGDCGNERHCVSKKGKPNGHDCNANDAHIEIDDYDMEYDQDMNEEEILYEDALENLYEAQEEFEIAQRLLKGQAMKSRFRNANKRGQKTQRGQRGYFQY